MRIFHVILVTLVPFSSVLAQGAAESAKTEALVLKAQTVELESLKAEIKAQGEKIDRLTQEVATLSDMLKQKSAPTVAKAEPVPTATPRRRQSSRRQPGGDASLEWKIRLLPITPTPRRTLSRKGRP